MEFSADVTDDAVGLLDAAEQTDLAIEDDRLADDARRPRYLSPSSAALYRQCAKKWKFRYQDRLPDPPGPAALAGTFAHRVLEVLMGLEPTQRTQETAKEVARSCWPEIEADPDFAALQLDEEAKRRFRWQGWIAIEGLWALEDPRTIDVKATELDVLVEVEGVPFRGIVDRLDGEGDDLVVIDYKSGRAPSPRFTNDRLDQVLMYAAAVHAETGTMPRRAALHYLGQRSIAVDVTNPRLSTTIRDLQDTWAALSSDVANEAFAAGVGPLCAWCPFVESCPEGKAEVRRRHAEGSVRHDAPALTVLAAAS